MAEETRNAEVVRGALQVVFSEHRLDQVNQFFSPSFVQHSPYAVPGGRDELRQWWAGIVEAIPTSRRRRSRPGRCARGVGSRDRVLCERAGYGWPG
jgi:predicted SnoaL-like aldol condensation-catalyzing enzyme